jgi:hypothetical protein
MQNLMQPAGDVRTSFPVNKYKARKQTRCNEEDKVGVGNGKRNSNKK